MWSNVFGRADRIVADGVGCAALFGFGGCGEFGEA
jgi:hypothetical protein